jgi:hypothetical protein
LSVRLLKCCDSVHDSLFLSMGGSCKLRDVSHNYIPAVTCKRMVRYRYNKAW